MLNIFQVTCPTLTGVCRQCPPHAQFQFYYIDGKWYAVNNEKLVNVTAQPIKMTLITSSTSTL